MAEQELTERRVERGQELRELARNAAPGPWHVANDADSVRLLALEGQQIAVLTGVWEPGTAKYLATIGPNTAYLLAELV
ncbi:hypothetical protein [Actinocrispum sp. NPDC049592]|uniref:hypothetical protein n=1 Tax=Actinocrispum sp. NPDC049592 TaxID=3154835 RepID=UPI00342D3CB2